MHTFAAAIARGEPCFDVRPRAQYEQGSVPGALHLSLEQIQAGVLPEVARDTPIYLLCERGLMSELAGLYLEAAGFTRVYNVGGGLKAWRQTFGEADQTPAD